MSDGKQQDPTQPPVLPPVVVASVFAAHVSPLPDAVTLLDGTVRVELWPGPFKLTTTRPRRLVSPGGMAYTADTVEVHFPEGSYLVMQLQASPDRDEPIRAMVSITFAKIAGLLQTIHPSILAEHVFEGPLAKEGEFVIWPEHPLVCRARTPCTPDALADSLRAALTAAQGQPEENRERLALGSRLLMKALTLESPVDRLLALWTILEVHAAADNNIIQAMTRFLSAELDIDQGLIKKRLQLGETFGYRCDIVHRGLAHVPPEQRSRFDACLARLSATVIFCLRRLAGSEGGDILDEYLLDTPPTTEQT